MRAWHETELSDQELSESFDDAMREDGLDPDDFNDVSMFTDRVNREACEAGNQASEVRSFNRETGEAHPPWDGAMGWLSNSWFGRQAFKE